MTMDVGDALRNLADLVDAIDDSAADVTDATPQTVHEDGRCVATLTVEIPADGSGLDAPVRPADEATGSDGPARPTGGDSPTRSDASHSDETERADAAVAGTAASPRRARTVGRIQNALVDPTGETGETSETAPDADGGDPDPGSDGPDSAVDGADPDSTGGDADEAANPRSARSDDDASGSTAGTDRPSTPDPDDRVDCTRPDCEATFDSEHGMRIHRSKAHDESGPARDPDRLRTVYETESSFEAMREALDADVSAQTVRRWMMSAGIHTVDDATAGSQPDHGDARRRDDDDNDPEPSGPSSGSEATAQLRGDDANGDGDADAEDDVDVDGAVPSEQSPDASAPGEAGAGPSRSESEADATAEESDGPDRETVQTEAESAPAPADAGADQGPSEQTDWPTPDRRYLPDDEALPAGVTATQLRSAVEDASTLYDVQQRLELDRETARDVLAEYDLLELVHGRVADRRRREELKEEIDDRLRSNATPADSPSD